MTTVVVVFGTVVVVVFGAVVVVVFGAVVVVVFGAVVVVVARPTVVVVVLGGGYDEVPFGAEEAYASHALPMSASHSHTLMGAPARRPQHFL